MTTISKVGWDHGIVPPKRRGPAVPTFKPVRRPKPLPETPASDERMPRHAPYLRYETLLGVGQYSFSQAYRNKPSGQMRASQAYAKSLEMERVLADDLTDIRKREAERERWHRISVETAEEDRSHPYVRLERPVPRVFRSKVPHQA